MADLSSFRISSTQAAPRRTGVEKDPPATPVSCVGRELAPRLSGVGREEARHNVYVVRLEREVLTKKKFAEANTGRCNSGLCLYVGLTGLTPTERFGNHKSGYKASRWVRDYGIELLPRFYAPLNKMSYPRADEVEEVLAEFLRGEGHAVWQK